MICTSLSGLVSRISRAGLVACALVSPLFLGACGGGGGAGGSGNEDDPIGGGGGGGGGGNGNMGINGEDGGAYAPPVANNLVVGQLEVEVPDTDEFLLRGNFPVIPGTFPRQDGKHPFVLVDYNGAHLETQNELVTRYADEADGADVLEVIARVRRDPAADPGDRAIYRIVQDPRGTVASPGTPGIEDLTNETADLPQAVLDLLADPTAIRVSTTDVFGNEYACYPLDGTGSMRVERYGKNHSQVRVYQTMAAEPAVPGAFGTLPHFFGVHTYISTLRDEEIVLFDVRISNASSGREQGTSMDDVLDKVYFERIEVAVPTGWVMQQGFDDPFFGAGYLDGTKTVYPIVEPIPGGLMHVMRWQGQFHRRLALSTTAATDQARLYLDGYGQGFCRRGVAGTGGHDFWSWWNEGTDRYWPQNHQLPSLDHIGLASIRSTLGNTLSAMANHLANGTGDGIYPFQSGVLGWGHPYGVPYGGATSGAEIYMYDGVMTAAASSREGYKVFLGTHRMASDRQPSALYELDGTPSSVEDWLISQGGNGSNDYVPFDHYGVPILRPGDPFGFDQAPQFHIDQVVGTARTPQYEDDHFNYDPIDLQHLIRYTRSPKVLVWLGNDPLAKDDLLMQAEAGNLSYHQYNNSSYGGQQMTGMRYNIEEVAGNPADGMTYGRGEAWVLDAMTATYAFADPAWRSAKRSWFDAHAQLVSDGQIPCSGFVQSMVRPKFIGGMYHARQMIEQSIMENAFRGMRETVYRDADPAYFAMMGDTLVNSLYGFVSDMAWFPGETAPWTHSAVAPLDPDLAPWCSRSQMPGNGFTAQYEGYQVWASFAFGYDLSGDQKFLDKALLLSGAQSLLNGLQGAGLGNIYNQAPTLALVQRMNGSL